MEDLKGPAREYDKNRVFWLSFTPILGLIVAPIYGFYHGYSLAIWGVFAFYMVATGLSITAGYHRLFAHCAYRASWGVRLFFLLFGAAALQNSALKWVSDHRLHHAFTDTDRDPYNIKGGFFYAHIKWVCLKDLPGRKLHNVRDLKRDYMFRFQHEHFNKLSLSLGLAAPALIGWALGDALGCFLLAAMTRMVIVHHSTFLVNSLAHWSGTQPYCRKDSSRDSFITALLTYGEGYHNFHHRFPYDFRNGLRWFQWDPTKWLIRVFDMVGWADNLKRAPSEKIFKARLEVQRQLAQEGLVSHSLELRESMEEKLHAAYEVLVQTRERCEQLKAECRTVKASVKVSMDHKYREIADYLKQELETARRHYRDAHDSWSALIQGCTQVPAAA